MVIILGLMIALACQPGHAFALKGPTIFVSLLPMIVTPLIGALILFWMIDAQGVHRQVPLQWIFDDPDLSLKASPSLTWMTLADLRRVARRPLCLCRLLRRAANCQHRNSSRRRGSTAPRAWQQVRYVVIPHLMPLAVFVSLIQLMDNFRSSNRSSASTPRPTHPRCQLLHLQRSARRRDPAASTRPPPTSVLTVHRRGNPAGPGADPHLARFQRKGGLMSTAARKTPRASDRLFCPPGSWSSGS